MKNIDWKKVQTIAGTYTRGFVAAVVAAYMSGITDPKVIIHSGIAAIVPVILRWANPKDSFPVNNSSVE